jgi:hypothetical protein
MVMVVGPSRIGILIEVGVVEWYGDVAIAHSRTTTRGNT